MEKKKKKRKTNLSSGCADGNGLPAGTLPPSCSMNDLKNSNCGIFSMVGFCEHNDTKNFNFLISSAPIGHSILLFFLSCLTFLHEENKNEHNEIVAVAIIGVFSCGLYSTKSRLGVYCVYNLCVNE